MVVVNRTIAPAKPKTGGLRLQLVPLLLFAACVVAAIGLLRVVQTSQVTTASFAMQDMQQEKLELETGVRQLEAEVASLSSLDRIERDAKRLGLESPVRISNLSVNVAWPSTAEDLLPARFAPAEDTAATVAVDGNSESPEWWQDLFSLLPFN